MKRYAGHMLVLSLFASVFLAGGASADEVVLENGNVITGKVVKLEKGSLTLTTGFSEPISVQTSKVRRITTDEPVEVHLPGGEVVKGKLSSPEPGQVVIDGGEGRGPVAVSWERVESVNPPAVAVEWTGSVTAGANLQTGNTERTSASIGAEAVKQSEIDRASFKLLYNYAEEGGEMTARNIFGAIKYDYFFTEKFYGYLSVELLSDKFRDIKLRSVVGPGAGYQLWDEKTSSLLLELGAAYFSEDLYAGVDDSWVTTRAAASFAWQLMENLKFTDSLVINNRLEDLGDFQLRNEAAITTGLGANWAMKLTNIAEYDSEPSPGFKSTDMFWILGLQYTF
jgi:putative salt-induced outer membrane protein YdiY